MLFHPIFREKNLNFSLILVNIHIIYMEFKSWEAVIIISSENPKCIWLTINKTGKCVSVPSPYFDLFSFPWDVPLQLMLTQVFWECPSIDLFFRTLFCIRLWPMKIYKLSNLVFHMMLILLILFKLKKGTFLGTNVNQDELHSKNKQKFCCPGIW